MPLEFIAFLKQKVTYVCMHVLCFMLFVSAICSVVFSTITADENKEIYNE